MKKTITVLVVVFVLLVIFLLLGPFYILYEGEQAVITRFGKIIGTAAESGLKIKVPLVDTVVKYPKMILSWDGDAQRLPTKENQFIWVDTTARWQITDPALFYESVNSLTSGVARLDDIIDSTIRTVISEHYLNEAVRNTNKINEMNVIEQVQNIDNLEDAEQLRNLTVTNTQQESIKIGREGLSGDILTMASQFTEGFGIKSLILLSARYATAMISPRVCISA